MSDLRTESGQSDDDIRKDVCKCSYSLPTAQRINLISSVSRQTLLMSNESKDVLETSLTSQEGVRLAKTKYETAELSFIRTRSRWKRQKDNLDRLKKLRDDRNQLLQERRDSIMDKFQGLKDVMSSLNEQRNRIDSEERRLHTVKEDLSRRRAVMIRELFNLIYPINLPSTDLNDSQGWTPPSISGFFLPDTSSQQQHSSSTINLSVSSSSWSKTWSQSMFGSQKMGGNFTITEDHLSIAVGHVVHLVVLLSKFTDIPLKYDLEFWGSRSLIIDHINIGAWKQILGHQTTSSNSSPDRNSYQSYSLMGRKRDGVQVSLFVSSKGSKDSRVYFNYGMYLMNQVIGQLKWTLCSLHKKDVKLLGSQSDFMQLKRIDLTKTLGNLHDILFIYSNLLMEQQDDLSSTNHEMSTSQDVQDISLVDLTLSSPTSSSSDRTSSSHKKDDQVNSFLSREVEAMLRSEEQLSESNGSSLHVENNSGVKE